MRCTYCGSGLHPTSHCPKTWGGQGNRRSLRCTYCGDRGHNYEACPRVHRVRPSPDGVTIRDKRK